MTDKTLDISCIRGYHVFPTYSELRATFKEKLDRSWVTSRNSDKITYSGTEQTYKIDLGGNRSKQLDLNNTALNQLLNFLKVNVNQYKRSPSWLKDYTFNHFNHSPTKNLSLSMVNLGDREKIQTDMSTSICRAVVSTTYGIVSDYSLISNIFPYINKTHNYLIRLAEYDENLTRILVRFDDTVVSHEGIEYAGGLQITNSETGQSSIWIEPIVIANDHPWPNRQILARQGTNCRIVHRGEVTPERTEKLVEEVSKISQVGIIQLVEAHKEKVSRKTLIDYVKSSVDLPSRWISILTDSIKEDEELSRVRAAEWILDLAKELPLFKKCRAQQEAGRFVGLFDHFHNRMSQIIGDIQND